jgi:hypothetical protein
MENNPQLDVILDTIRKEHRRTQLIFGVGIVILALILAILAPVVIRLGVAQSSFGESSYGASDSVPADMYGDAMPEEMESAGATSTASSTQ